MTNTGSTRCLRRSTCKRCEAHAGPVACPQGLLLQSPRCGEAWSCKAMCKVLQLPEMKLLFFFLDFSLTRLNKFNTTFQVCLYSCYHIFTDWFLYYVKPFLQLNRCIRSTPDAEYTRHALRCWLMMKQLSIVFIPIMY